MSPLHMNSCAAERRRPLSMEDWRTNLLSLSFLHYLAVRSQSGHLQSNLSAYADAV